jgi:ribosome maturation factor RimP
MPFVTKWAGTLCYPPVNQFRRLRNWARERPFFVSREEMPSIYDKEKALYAQVAARIEKELPGTDVLALELIRNDRFCVYIDHSDGVTLELCEAVTHALDDFRGDYGIDVSSPGFNRPLRTPAHFAAVVGEQISIRTERDIDGAIKFRGELVAAGEDGISVTAGDTTVHIPYAQIVRGNLIDEG